jgi:hypothetical protein
LVEVTVTLLFLSPDVVPVTFTENVHEPLVARVAPARLTVPEPAVAVIVPPPQVPLNPFGVATTNPVGRLSVKATPVSATVFATGLVRVKVKVVVPFTAIKVAPKLLLIVGGATTVSGAEAVRPVRATGPPAVGALVVFVTPPGVELVTFMTTWQLLPAAMEAALKRTAPSPAAEAAPVVLVTVPQRVGVNVKVVFSNVSPVGKVSSTWTVVNAPGFAAGLASVRVNVVLPPTGIDAAPKDLVSVGGMYAVTVSGPQSLFVSENSTITLFGSTWHLLLPPDTGFV